MNIQDIPPVAKGLNTADVKAMLLAIVATIDSGQMGVTEYLAKRYDHGYGSGHMDITIGFVDMVEFNKEFPK